MTRGIAVASWIACALFACSEGAIVIGDDTGLAPSPADPLVDPDASPFEASTEDAPPITVNPPEAGTDGAADAKADVTCPTLSPPAPGFCDGASPVPLYDSNACIVGYGCGPVACATAGGTCTGISPSSCPAPKKWGDATKYSCGGGIGSGCCLP